MSDSEVSEENASVFDAQLEKTLRLAVERTYKSDPEQLTLKRLRTQVEKELGLKDGFFKSNSTWNTRSKEVIQSEVAAQETQSQPPSSQIAAVTSPKEERRPPKNAVQVANGKKRTSTGDEGPSKRRRKGATKEDMFSGNESASSRPSYDTPNRRTASSSPLSEIDRQHVQGAQSEEAIATAADDAPGQDSESEMSVLIDEDPKPKKRSRKTSSEKPGSKKERSKTAKATQQPTDPDAEEIKRLQGWLVKCGIRKMWFRELAPYDTSKAKIRHLKDMLTKAGMSGRYSQEKATQIREERELQADIEAVQAGAKQWGKAESDDEEGPRPRRRVARGLQELDFLKDDDGEESD